MKTFGMVFKEKRLALNYTQGEIGDKLGISGAAVSKYEKELGYPDITLLPSIADLFQCSIDELFDRDKSVRINDNKKDMDKLVFVVEGSSAEGDKMKLNLPLPLIKVLVSSGQNLSAITNNEKLSQIDFKELLALVEQGLLGEIFEGSSANGDKIKICVE